jgi:hypothetical protein
MEYAGAAGAVGPAQDTDAGWKSPAGGRPLNPGDVKSPSAGDIAAAVKRALVVPRGPCRTVTLLLGATTAGTISVNALNSKIQQPILAAPGVITSIEVIAQIVATGAAAGLLQLFDNDTNSPLIRTIPVNVGAAGTFSVIYTTSPRDLPFLGGITAVWTPITAGFGASIICVNIDFDSIPIGQRNSDNV